MAHNHTFNQEPDLAHYQQLFEQRLGRSVSDSKFRNKYLNYRQAVTTEMLIGINQVDTAQNKLNHIPIAWNRLRVQAGRTKNSQGRLVYDADVFLDMELLVRLVNKGSNFKKEKTIVTPTIPVEFLLSLATDKEVVEAVWSGPYDTTEDKIRSLAEVMDQHPELIDYSPVDINSLEAFISRTQREAESATAPALKNKLQNNLQQARIFRAIYRVHGNLPQVAKNSAFGRRYYSGPNLQTCSRELRSAVLGDCHQYDIKTSVYSWKLDQARKLLSEQGQSAVLSYTLEYIDQRNYHRRRLGVILQNKLGLSEERAVRVIKEMFTAVGFGATANSNGWFVDGEYQRPALRQIIKNQEVLKQILQDEFVYEFMKEQTEINDIIIKYYRDKAGSELRSIPALKDKLGRLSRNRVMAFLYQHFERDWLEGLCETICQYSPDTKIMLKVHDAIYTDRPAPLCEMKEYLRSQNEFADIESSRIGGWHNYSEQDQLQTQHQQRIAQEEARAAQLLGVAQHRPQIRFRCRETVVHQKDLYDGQAEYNYRPEEDPALDDLDMTPAEYAESRNGVLGTVPAAPTVDPRIADILKR